jgi:hypothetical protein
VNDPSVGASSGGWINGIDGYVDACCAEGIESQRIEGGGLRVVVIGRRGAPVEASRVVGTVKGTNFTPVSSFGEHA